MFFAPSFHISAGCGVEACGETRRADGPCEGCGNSVEGAVDGQSLEIPCFSKFSTASAPPTNYYVILNPSSPCGGGRKEAPYEIFL